MFINRYDPEIEGLGRWNPLKKVEKGLRRIARHDPLLQAAKRLDTKIKAEIARSKYAQGIIYGAGVVAAPFTGGASLAVAAAAVQSSKASKKGRSFGAQLIQGAGAGAIGWVAGVGLVYGAGAVGIGPAAVPGQAASFLTPFGTSGLTAAQTAAAASDAGMLYAPAGAAPVSSVVSAAAPGAFSVGGALKTTADIFGVANLIRGAVSARASPSGPLDPAYYATATVPPGYDGGGGGSVDAGGGGGGVPGEVAPGETSPGMFMQGKGPLILGGVALAVTAALLLKRKRGRMS